MQTKLKSVVTPSSSSLSKKVTIDFSTVPADEIQGEAVQRVKNYLGDETYRTVKSKICAALSQSSCRFIELEVAFMMVGIESALSILMLVQEWKLSNKVVDFDSKMDDFLESCTSNKE